ncbi:MAG: ATP-binding protein [Planctomycetota bacterium]|jgi:signal transduction histidine kinase
MKATGRIKSGDNQLWWVVSLLSMAVILPTVCLLWFMTQAVRNDRLAVKQKLINVYEQRFRMLSDSVDDLWSARIASVREKAQAQLEPVEIFALLAGEGRAGDGSGVCDAVVIYDGAGTALYPIVAETESQEEFPEQFNKAWRAEFTENDFARAIRLYEQIAESHYDDYVSYSALMGRIRCLRKSSQMQKAIALCREMAYGQAPQSVSASSISLITRARILLVELQGDAAGGPELADFQELIGSAVDYTTGGDGGLPPMSSQTRTFFLRKAIELAEGSDFSQELTGQLARARTLLATEELASAFLDKYDTSEASRRWSQEDVVKLLSLLRSTMDRIEQFEWDLPESVQRQLSSFLDSYRPGLDEGDVVDAIDRPALATLLELWPENSVRRLELPEVVFAVRHSVDDRAYLLLQRQEQFDSDFASSGRGLEKLGIAYKVTDGSVAYASGLESGEGPAFMKVPLGQFFPGWHVDIHFKDVDIFETTADRQKMVYIWAGLLAIAVMLSAGLLTARVVGKQIKTNKLKNDFIATVSHELKTPLASMRVLVDTLLEGSYRDQQQVTEYLELVSKENERLTGLIDNFLSFSRMERNKQAFGMTPTNPGRIARDAAEAVKTKFSAGQCVFAADIAEDLPDVLADRDAMVTVLVNLLDNAYKYSYDDKRIELRAFVQNGSVYFSVCDNGLGMSRRSAKKVFKRFYQVDRSLSRGAEGCGLGLSIAKFIVDTHRGSIDVESKPGEGSTFTVTLPAIK